MSDDSRKMGHVQPIGLYVKVLLALFALTGVTFVVSYQDFGIFNNLVAVAIATVKASLVVLIFMHGKYEGNITWAFIYYPFLLLLLLLGALYLDYGTRDEKDFAVQAKSIVSKSDGHGDDSGHEAAAPEATAHGAEATLADEAGVEDTTSAEESRAEEDTAAVEDASTGDESDELATESAPPEATEAAAVEAAASTNWGDLPGDAARGLQKAKVLCIACHVVDGVGFALPGAPPFEESANLARITPDYLRKWLKDPPAVKPGTLMPNFGISDQDIEDYIALLQTYKK